jgi:hypothetical protein
LPEGGDARQKLPLKRLGLLAFAAFLVGASIVAAVLATSGGPSVPGAGIAPADFVGSSTQNTLAKHTADFVFNGSVSVDAQVIPLNGWGRVDFTTNAFSGTVVASSSTISYVERELLAKGHLYMALAKNGHDVSDIAGGAEWIDLPVVDQNGGNSPGLGIVEPMTRLRVFESKGATVVPLGTSVIGGETVSGYAFRPSRAGVLQALRQEFAAERFSTAQEQQFLNTPNGLGSFTSQVWLSAPGIVRRLVMTIGGGMTGATGKIEVTFQSYGAPVSIRPPAANAVISYSSYNSDLQSAINKAT